MMELRQLFSIQEYLARDWKPSSCTFSGECSATTCGISSSKQGVQVVVDEFPNAADADIRGRIAGQGLWISGVVPLAREHGGDSPAPGSLDGCQDAQLVIYDDVAVSGVAFKDVVQLKLLVHVDQNVAIYGGEQAGASDLKGLKYYVTVRQDYWPAKLLHIIYNVERIGKEPVGE